MRHHIYRSLAGVETLLKFEDVFELNAKPLHLFIKVVGLLVKHSLDLFYFLLEITIFCLQLLYSLIFDNYFLLAGPRTFMSVRGSMNFCWGSWGNSRLSLKWRWLMNDYRLNFMHNLWSRFVFFYSFFDWTLFNRITYLLNNLRCFLLQYLVFEDTVWLRK